MSETLQASRVSVEAGGRLIVDGVDCTAPAGAVTGVLGPNGSGKTTLLRLVTGTVPTRQGAVLLGGVDLGTLTRRDRARRLALVSQEAPADAGLAVLDVVLLGRTPHRSRWGGDSPDDVALARTCLARVAAADLADRELATLSGGERQRVHLAAALAQEPRLLLLDEPTNHLDVAAQLDMLALARRLADDGVTVVMALHDLNHALGWCDHVVLLAGGRVRAAGPPAAVLTPERIAEVYGVRAEVVHLRGRAVLVLDALPDPHPPPPERAASRPGQGAGAAAPVAPRPAR
jgi:iron complex transport system ATP-binding protein